MKTTLKAVLVAAFTTSLSISANAMPTYELEKHNDLAIFAKATDVKTAHAFEERFSKVLKNFEVTNAPDHVVISNVVIPESDSDAIVDRYENLCDINGGLFVEEGSGDDSYSCRSRKRAHLVKFSFEIDATGNKTRTGQLEYEYQLAVPSSMKVADIMGVGASKIYGGYALSDRSTANLMVSSAH